MADNTVVFIARTKPDTDLNVRLIIEDYIDASIEGAEITAWFVNSLNTLYVEWLTPHDNRFFTWQSDSILIEQCVNESQPSDPASWERVFLAPLSSEQAFSADEFANTPCVIGNDPGGTDYSFTFGRKLYRVRILTSYMDVAAQTTGYVYSRPYEFRGVIRTDLLYDTIRVDVQSDMADAVMYDTVQVEI